MYSLIVCLITIFMLVVLCRSRETVCNSRSLNLLNKRHILGTLIFVAPTLILAPGKVDVFQLQLPETTIIWLIPAICLSVSASIYAAKNQEVKMNKGYGEAVRYFAARIPFLIAYELFFRGVFLHILLDLLPAMWPIYVNVAFYTIAHSYSTRKELIGSIPFGIILCSFTVYSGSVLPAILLHLSLSLPYEIMSILKSTQTKLQTR